MAAKMANTIDTFSACTMSRLSGDTGCSGPTALHSRSSPM